MAKQLKVVQWEKEDPGCGNTTQMIDRAKEMRERVVHQRGF
jgi:hypothetical protein